jgi:hypothetical protein
MCVLLFVYVRTAVCLRAYCCLPMCLLLFAYVRTAVCLCAYCCLSMCVLLFVYVRPAVVTLDAGLLARSQYSDGPATDHLDTGFSWSACVYKRMLRWFPRFQVATICFSCSPPDLNVNLLVISFVYLYTCKITIATG